MSFQNIQLSPSSPFYRSSRRRRGDFDGGEEGRMKEVEIGNGGSGSGGGGGAASEP